MSDVQLLFHAMYVYMACHINFVVDMYTVHIIMWPIMYYLSMMYIYTCTWLNYLCVIMFTESNYCLDLCWCSVMY